MKTLIVLGPATVLLLLGCGGKVVIDTEELYPDNPCGQYATCEECSGAPPDCHWYWPPTASTGGFCQSDMFPPLPREGCYPAKDCEDGCGAGSACTSFRVRTWCTLCGGAVDEACGGIACTNGLSLCLSDDDGS